MTISRKEALARTFASAFSALDDHRQKDPADAAEIYAVIVAHVRSSFPQALILVDTGQVPLVDPAVVELADAKAEIAKLRVEIEHVRPVYVAALRWREDSGDINSTIALELALRAASGEETGL